MCFVSGANDELQMLQMSKQTGNFLTLSGAIEKYSADGEQCESGGV